MQLNRILAVALIVLCLIAAVIGGTRPPEPEVAASRPAAIKAPIGRDRIAVIALQGAIASGSSGFIGDTSAPAVRELFLAAAKDEHVKGILLKINSPGGTVGTSQEVYRAIQAARKAEKPVVVIMEDVAASGGYYIASAADKIYANPGTLTGSIGVILQSVMVQELFNKIGIQSQTIKTGDFKDIFSPYRPLTPTEKDLLQKLVDDTLSQFISDVAAGRQQLPKTPAGKDPILTEQMIALRQALSEERVRQLADGRIYTGRQAVEVGLIDAIGGYQEAVADLRLLLGDKDEKLPVGDESTNLDRFIRRYVLQSMRGSVAAPPMDLGSFAQQLGLSSASIAGGSLTQDLLQVPLLWLAPQVLLQS
jgi:protease-4